MPMDRYVVRKYADKLTSYRDIKIEIHKCWDLRTVKTVPVIVDALGTVCDGL